VDGSLGIQLGAAGVQLAALFWFARYYIRNISSGEWVPKRELDYIRADRDARIAEISRRCEEKDATIADWRAAHETSERTREIQAGTIRDAIEAVRHSERLHDAFREIITRLSLQQRPGDGEDVARPG
jgi:hypothetical protein